MAEAMPLQFVPSAKENADPFGMTTKDDKRKEVDRKN
jgi:hypothetical protein